MYMEYGSTKYFETYSPNISWDWSCTDADSITGQPSGPDNHSVVGHQLQGQHRKLILDFMLP